MMSDKTDIFSFPLKIAPLHWFYVSCSLSSISWVSAWILALCLILKEPADHGHRRSSEMNTAADTLHLSFADYKCVVFTNNPFLCDNKHI